MTKEQLMGSAADVADPIAADFRNMLYLIWEHLGLPEPTPAQYELAYFMQYGLPDVDYTGGRRDILMGFRGVAKSYISAAFTIWRLYKDPVNEKILVTSASGTKAKEFVSQVKSIISTMPLLAKLRPKPGQRDQADRFDVPGASISQSPSVKAAGITGQITGSRATLIIADDIEIPENSKTEDSRNGLLRITNEFDAIILPGNYDIIFLGTPQTEESIYNRKIKEQGYNCFCWPARYPVPEKRANYVLKREDGTSVDILAPPLRLRLEADPALAGKPTDPTRFDDAELLRREAKGRSFFALQYQLDTSLSDAERYPLKAFDLIVMGVGRDKAPITVQWGRHTDRKNVLDDIPNYGFSGDYCLGPLFLDSEWRNYEGSVLFVDPSGRGADETAWAILKVLNGYFYLTKLAGHKGDVNEAMIRIATDARDFKVNVIEIEPNFAPGVWISAFQPILARVWPGGCTVQESEWAKGQKEARIIDTLEPVMNQHRLVVDEEVARDETFMYQLTHITRERGSLKHDDRLDAVAGAVSFFQRTLMQDVSKQAEAMRMDEIDRMVEEFVEDARTPYRRFRRRARVTGRTEDGRLVRVVDREVEVYST
jgi:hypothetical protein